VHKDFSIFFNGRTRNSVVYTCWNMYRYTLNVRDSMISMVRAPYRQTYEGPVYPGEHPYQCAYCAKRFKQVGHVHQHERTHTGQLKYECATCHKRFNQLSHIREHERIHTGEKPFGCSECGKRFTFRHIPSTIMTTSHYCFSLQNFLPDIQYISFKNFYDFKI
jgi:uncharacterized Zn-finger protein